MKNSQCRIVYLGIILFKNKGKIKILLYMKAKRIDHQQTCMSRNFKVLQSQRKMLPVEDLDLIKK